MILAAIGTITFLASLTLLWRRAVEMRVIRWRLYELRDSLRHMAYENPELLRSGVFRSLDHMLSAHSSQLNEISLWTILPRVLFSDRQKIEGIQRDFEMRLRQPKNQAMIPIYERSAMLIGRHLAWRHIFLSIVAVVTILGIVLCHQVGKWLGARIISGAVLPVTSAPIAKVAA